MLAQRVDEVWLAFDGDPAGREAAKKAAVHLMQEDVTVRVVTFPDGKDPGDLLQEDRSGFTQYFAHPSPVWSLWSPAGTRPPYGVMRQLVNHIRDVRQPLRQVYLLQDLSEWTGIPREALEKEMQKQTTNLPKTPHRRAKGDRDLLLKVLAFLAWKPDLVSEEIRAWLEEVMHYVSPELPHRVFWAVIQGQEGLAEAMALREDVASVAAKVGLEVQDSDLLEKENLRDTVIWAARQFLRQTYQKTRDARVLEQLERFLKRRMREEDTRDGQHNGENQP